MTAVSENDLHLPNLTVRRFRGIQNLSMERLGRVTLIAGKNGVGKTTVLDAIRTYAARGNFSVIASILTEREELPRTVEEDDDEMLVPEWDALFYGRRALPDDPIVIGPADSSRVLSIRATPSIAEDGERWVSLFPDQMLDENVRMLRVKFEGNEQAIPFFTPSNYWRPRLLNNESDPPPGIRCESLGPSVLGNNHIARLWDRVALTDDENRAVEALRLIFGDMVERAAVIGDDTSSRSRLGRRAVVRIAGQKSPVPLRSLGDGAVRLFGVALALANSQGGFLLIDEAENGIHYSLQRDFWRMVLLTAQANNVQVFATTHSWDCAAGFAQAAVDAEGVEGALVRLDSDGENIRAVEYSERQLQVAAEQGIEVR